MEVGRDLFQCKIVLVVAMSTTDLVQMLPF